MFKIYSLVKSQDSVATAKTLDQAKTLAYWNFQRGYRIETETGQPVMEYRHFCPQCRTCKECGHLKSEHYGEDGKPQKCTIKKCKCKDFVEKQSNAQSGTCCNNEDRNINGGCNNCGDPCL